MIKLLADANIEGQVALLTACMQADPWREFWNYLELRLFSFADVGLEASDSDVVVWQCCQTQGVYLITDNRNDDGPESLESTIRANSTPASLPVFTIADIRKVVASPEYRQNVIDRLLQYLLEKDAICGTGRLFLP